MRNKFSKLLRRFTADTLAMLLFSACTGIIGLLFEWLVAGRSPLGIAGSRVPYNIIKHAVGGVICPKIADVVRSNIIRGPESFIRRSLTDGLGLSIFQVPLYAIFSALAGARPKQVGLMTGYFFINNLLLAPLYRFFLNRVRPWFKVQPPKP